MTIIEDMTARINPFETIELVCFDLDDTLWDIDPVIQKAEMVLYDWLKKHTPRITHQYSLLQVQERRAEFSQLNPDLKVDVTVMRKESLRSLFAEFGYAEDKVEDAFSIFYKARSEVSLYPDALSVLGHIAKHYQLAALTNGNADLGIVGIDHLFDDIQQATMSLAPKPHPDMFLESSRVLGISPANILHVGDNPVADVQGGKAAGVHTVWFNQKKGAWPDDLAPADHEVSSLSGLLSVLPKCVEVEPASR